MSTQTQRRPDLEGVAALAMKLGGRHLADYGATRSRHDFTQRQLMSCLILRAYLKTTYRGVLEHLKNCPALRRELGLADKLPHYSTLQKFSARSRVLEIADKLIQSIGQAAAAMAPEGETAAMDATGLELTSASTYYQTKCGKRRHKWVKLSAIVLCGSLLPLSISLDLGAKQRPVSGSGIDFQSQTGGHTCQTVCRSRLRCRVDS